MRLSWNEVRARAAKFADDFVTRCVFCRTPEWVLSIKFVLVKQRRSRGGRPSRLIVNISPSPSRRLAAAEG